MFNSNARVLVALSVVTVVGAGVTFGVASCQPTRPEPRGQLGSVAASAPTQLCVAGDRDGCRPVDAIRRTMGERLTFVQAAAAPGGGQGAAVLTFRSPEGLTFDTKWRSLGSESRFNDPLSELGADQVQRLVLDPSDVVIPPATPHCLPEASYEGRLGHARDAFPGSRCVLGILSLWLHGSIDMGEARAEGVVPGQAGDSDPKLFDPDRFDSDPIYRRNLAQLNLVAYLIDHGDAHAGQFMAYRVPVHLFLVDNSVAFGLDHRSSMAGRQDLAHLIVPSIPSDTAERLRALTRDRVDGLRVLAELRIDSSGQLVPTAPTEPFGEPDERVRQQGERVQLGLSVEQIDGVWSRLEHVRARLTNGSLGVF